MTRVLHAARISNVDSGMFLNGIRKKVNFELRKRNREEDKRKRSFKVSPYGSYEFKSDSSIEPLNFGRVIFK